MIVLAEALAADVLGVAVAASALCRLAPLHLVRINGVRHRPSWVAIYFAMFCGAVFALSDVWSARIDHSTLLLLFACATYLWQSRHTWRDGPPQWMTV
jgi:uncharacterized membrane protein (DUF2068 family)